MKSRTIATGVAALTTCIATVHASQQVPTVHVYQGLNKRCSPDNITFTFETPPSDPILEFLNYTTVQPAGSTNGKYPYDSVTPHSPTNVSFANVTGTPVEDAAPNSYPAISVPSNANYTFTLKSFYISSSPKLGTKAIVIGSRKGDDATIVTLFTLSGSTDPMQRLDFELLRGWSGLTQVAILVQNEAESNPYVIDDFTVERDC